MLSISTRRYSSHHIIHLCQKIFLPSYYPSLLEDIPPIILSPSLLEDAPPIILSISTRRYSSHHIIHLCQKIFPPSYYPSLLEDIPPIILSIFTRRCSSHHILHQMKFKVTQAAHLLLVMCLNSGIPPPIFDLWQNCV